MLRRITAVNIWGDQDDPINLSNTSGVEIFDNNANYFITEQQFWKGKKWYLMIGWSWSCVETARERVWLEKIVIGFDSVTYRGEFRFFFIILPNNFPAIGAIENHAFE